MFAIITISWSLIHRANGHHSHRIDRSRSTHRTRYGFINVVNAIDGWFSAAWQCLCLSAVKLRRLSAKTICSWNTTYMSISGRRAYHEACQRLVSTLFIYQHAGKHQKLEREKRENIEVENIVETWNIISLGSCNTRTHWHMIRLEMHTQ